MLKVYLSGPITGLNYQEARYGRRKQFADLLLPPHTVLSPMRHEGHLAELQGPIEKAYPENLFSRPKMIVAKDHLDIQECTIMVADLWGAKKVSIGTVAEHGYAFALNKTIVTIMEPGNIHWHPFITETSSVIVPTLEEAAVIVNSLLSEGL